MNENTRQNDVVALLANRVTVAQVAERHEVTVEEVERWREMYLAGLAEAQAMRAKASREWRRRYSAQSTV